VFRVHSRTPMQTHTSPVGAISGQSTRLWGEVHHAVGLLSDECADAVYADPPGPVSTPADPVHHTVRVSTILAQRIISDPRFADDIVRLLARAATCAHDDVSDRAAGLIESLADRFAGQQVQCLAMQGAFSADA
jgi:hypothetical protein